MKYLWTVFIESLKSFLTDPQGTLYRFLFDPAAIGDTKASWSIGLLILITWGSCLAAMLFGWSYRRKPLLSWTGFSVFLTIPMVMGIYFRSQAIAFHQAHPLINNVWSGYFWFPFFFSGMVFIIGLLVGTGLVKVAGQSGVAQPSAAADRTARYPGGF